MIIIAYDKVDIEELRKRENTIDLTSSTFWSKNNKIKNWHIIYCRIAEQLSEQGFDVIVVSDDIVQKELNKEEKDVVEVKPLLRRKK